MAKVIAFPVVAPPCGLEGAETLGDVFRVLGDWLDAGEIERALTEVRLLEQDYDNQPIPTHADD